MLYSKTKKKITSTPVNGGGSTLHRCVSIMFFPASSSMSSTSHASIGGISISVVRKGRPDVLVFTEKSNRVLERTTDGSRSYCLS